MTAKVRAWKLPKCFLLGLYICIFI